MKNIFLVALGLVLMGAGCFASTELPDQVTDNLPLTDELPHEDDEPISYGDDAIGDEVTITGTAMVGKFGGTEMTCAFAEAFPVAERMECNHGTVQIGLLTNDGREIWLDEYSCLATEVLLYWGDTEYEVSNCTDDIQIGGVYTFYGSLGWSVEPWHIGSENGEWLMTDAVLMH